METITLKVSRSTPTVKKILETTREVEVDPSVIEELFLLLISRKSKAGRKDIEEIASILEERAWERIKRRLQ